VKLLLPEKDVDLDSKNVLAHDNLATLMMTQHRLKDIASLTQLASPVKQPVLPTAFRAGYGLASAYECKPRRNQDEPRRNQDEPRRNQDEPRRNQDEPRRNQDEPSRFGV
jgi:hypothetical protein